MPCLTLHSFLLSGGNLGELPSKMDDTSKIITRTISEQRTVGTRVESQTNKKIETVQKTTVSFIGQVASLEVEDVQSSFQSKIEQKTRSFI